MFWLLLTSAFRVSRLSLFPTLPPQHVGWRWARCWRDRARTADLNWPKGDSIPNVVVLRYSCGYGVSLPKKPLWVIGPCLPGSIWTTVYWLQVKNKLHILLCFCMQLLFQLPLSQSMSLLICLLFSAHPARERSERAAGHVFVCWLGSTHCGAVWEFQCICVHICTLPR